jgi:hypothetical protein
MSFDQVCKELLSSAERSAVVKVVNDSSHQLEVKACNIWQGRWHIEPEAVPPHSEKVFAAKSQGRKQTTPIDCVDNLLSFPFFKGKKNIAHYLNSLFTYTIISDNRSFLDHGAYHCLRH